MQTLKNLLLGSLGTIGYILWYLVSILLLYAPLVFLDFPLLIDILIIFAITSLPFWGDVVELIIWIWSFVVVLSEPIDVISVIYFVTFAFYIFTKFLPIIKTLIKAFFNKN